MLNVSVVHIIPVVNPEGAAVSSPASCNNTLGKYNAKNVDLLSNFHSMLFSLNAFSFFCQSRITTVYFSSVEDGL